MAIDLGWVKYRGWKAVARDNSGEVSGGPSHVGKDLENFFFPGQKKKDRQSNMQKLSDISLKQCPSLPLTSFF